MAGDDHLPPEMLREVLARVPAKSILRFRSISKSWYSLVSCPSFISYHSNKNPNKNRLLLQLWDIKSNTVSFSSLDESFMESRAQDRIGGTSHGRGLEIVGSCNGLICLSEYSKDVVYVSGNEDFDVSWTFEFFVWNPTIRKIVEVQYRICDQFAYRPGFGLDPTGDFDQFVSYFGFGFDPKTGDYKILCATGDACKIFDLSKGVWRSISPVDMPPRRVGHIYQECYLDGAVHWSGENLIDSTDAIVLAFDMSDECFRDIKMPDSVELVMTDSSLRRVRSMAFRGLIYVIAWETNWKCSIWVMKEYGVAESWTKVLNISLLFSHIKPHPSVLLWGNGEVLMAEEVVGVQDRQLVMYNTERRRFECVFPLNHRRVVNMCLYEESLVLM